MSMASQPLTADMIAYYKAHADDTLQPNLIAAGVCGLIIAYAAVTARVFARRASGPKFGWDDWLILASLVPLSGYGGLTLYNVSIGDGRHSIYVTTEAGHNKAFIAQMVAYSVAIALIKLSILLFYHRIFPSRLIFHLSCVIGAIVIAYNIAIILVTTLQCIPLQSMWENPGKGHCISNTIPYTVISIVNVITDFLILALPVRPVWQLQMRTSRKLQTLFMFLLGAIVCIFGVVRVWSVATIPPVDPSWNDVYPEIWSFIEISIGVLAACLPTYGMLIKKAKAISQWSKSTTESQKPLEANHRIKVHGSMVFGSSSKDMDKSRWSKSFGAWSGASRDREHDVEFVKSYPFDNLDDDVDFSRNSIRIGHMSGTG